MPANAKTAVALLLLLLASLSTLPSGVQAHKSSKKKKKQTQKQVFTRASGGVADEVVPVVSVVPSLANTSYWMPELCRWRVNGSAVEVTGR